MHSQPMKDSDGTFDGWKACPTTACRRCKKLTVKSREWDSSDGAYEDYQFSCYSCGHTWWIEGPDA